VLGSGTSEGRRISEEPRGFDALALQVAVEAPKDIISSVQLLADFALKLSLGPVSRLWVPDVRRSVDALLRTGKHRNETALVALSTRLLEVLPNELQESGSSAAAEAGAVAAPIFPNAAVCEATAVSDAPVVSDASGVPDVSAASEPAVSEASATAELNAAAEPNATGEPNAAADASTATDASPPSRPSPASEDNSVPQDIVSRDGVTRDGAGDALQGTLRDRILHEVSRLAGVLPEWPAPAQDLAEEARRRETHVIRELVTQVDGLKRDQRARLEEQTRLEELANLSPEAIAEEFDAPLERAIELRRVLDDYRQERQTRAPDVGNAIGLSLALDELDRLYQAFDDCDPEQKDAIRALRALRRQALSAVNLLLAERGELEWLEQLEPLAIGERVERLKQWLDVGREDAGRERTY
jgi:hypothetical protein